jgi:hypothetical protein
LNGRYTLRFAIGNMQTNEEDVRETWQLVRDTSSRLTEAASIPAANT